VPFRRRMYAVPISSPWAKMAHLQSLRRRAHLKQDGTKGKGRKQRITRSHQAGASFSWLERCPVTVCICLLAFRSFVGEYGGGSDEEIPKISHVNGGLRQTVDGFLLDRLFATKAPC
jgi:hypothetical protein